MVGFGGWIANGKFGLTLRCQICQEGNGTRDGELSKGLEDVDEGAGLEARRLFVRCLEELEGEGLWSNIWFDTCSKLTLMISTLEKPKKVGCYKFILFGKLGLLAQHHKT